MEGLFGDGLVDEVLFCCGDNSEEDLRWEPRLGIFVDLVDFENDVVNAGTALFNPILPGLLNTRRTWGTYFTPPP